MSNQFNGVPFAEQYIGVWSILEAYGNSLIHQAQTLNIQLHLQQAQQPAAQSAIGAQASTDLNVTRDGVAIIQLQGSLTKHAASFSASRSMVAARRQIRAAVADASVAGILLHIDSPGGTVAGTVDLADDVASAAKQKPVYAYADDLCASAAYWIGSQANKVFSNRSAEIGSIGVFMAVVDWSAYAEKEGAKVHVVRFGRFKGAGLAGTEVTEEQLAEWQKSVDTYGDLFVGAVASGRGLSRTQAEQLADGRVHAAAAAVDLNLIDGIKSYDETLAALVAATKPKKGTAAMSEPTEKKAATHKELKAAMPAASSDFILAQLDKGATVAEALAEFNTQLAAENAALKKKAEEDKEKREAEEEEEKKKEDEAKKKGASRRGNKPAASEEVEVEATEVDYRQLATAYMEKHKCRWSEACLEIKRRHPDAQVAFGMPPAKAG